MALFVIGKESMEKGMNILGAHIDSPRLDLKQDPLYEDTDFAMLDTHYYGGIKKYQWVTLPLALHGVIAKKDGTVVKVNVGDKPGDPVFGVSDLLIHLSSGALVDSGFLDVVLPVQVGFQHICPVQGHSHGADMHPHPSNWYFKYFKKGIETAIWVARFNPFLIM